MKISAQILLVTGAFVMGATGPALADFVRLGSVDVGYRMDRDTSWSRFGGPMEGLRFVAGGSDILCRSVVVTYGNGERQNVFRGMLSERQPVAIDVRGGARRVKRVDFTCRSDRFRGGRIFVAADVGRYRAEWQQSPEWAGYWSRVFNWAPPRGGAMGGAFNSDRWVKLANEQFGFGGDRESHVTGWGGRNVDRIALRAIDGDARCTRLRAQFANGDINELNARSLVHMQQGLPYTIDLPGDTRNIVRLNLICRALGQQGVTIAIFARK
jgi:hypothetical protein